MRVLRMGAQKGLRAKEELKRKELEAELARLQVLLCREASPRLLADIARKAAQRAKAPTPSPPCMLACPALVTAAGCDGCRSAAWVGGTEL